MPPFWFGLLAIEFLAVQTQAVVRPGQHAASTSWACTRRDSNGINVDYARHLVLPVLTLTVQIIAEWSRYQRASMLDVHVGSTTCARPGPRACPGAR